MSQKRTEKIVSAIIDKVAESIEKKYRIRKNDIIEIIKHIPDSFRCKYTLVKGKRKGDLCNTVLCPHHITENQICESKTDSYTKLSDINTEYNFNIDINEINNKKYINTTQEDSDLATAIAESIMYSKVNTIRRQNGFVPLGVIK
jgi:hypothetical protein